MCRIDIVVTKINLSEPKATSIFESGRWKGELLKSSPKE